MTEVGPVNRDAEKDSYKPSYPQKTSLKMRRDYTMWQQGNTRREEMSTPKGLWSQKRRNTMSSNHLREPSLHLCSSGGLGKMGIPPGEFWTRYCNHASLSPLKSPPSHSQNPDQINFLRKEEELEELVRKELISLKNLKKGKHIAIFFLRSS